MKWLLLICCGTSIYASDTLTIGSKLHTESHLLSEMLAQLVEHHTDLQVVRKFRLGGTKLIHQALVSGEIDIYPEYTGTISQVILSQPDLTLTQMNDLLLAQQQWMGNPMGFHNTYALAVRKEVAAMHNLKRISDLATVSGLRWGLTHEFLNRSDGLPGLKHHYQLRLGTVLGIDKSLQYQAMESGEVDVIDAYSTDGRLERYPLVILADDRHYFPKYLPVWLARKGIVQENPQLKELLGRFENAWNDAAMRAINANVDVHQKKVEVVAAEALAERFGMSRHQAPAVGIQWRDIALKTRQHIWLTCFALLLSVAFGLPLGMALGHWPKIAEPVLAMVGILQTIPSLALLAFMIPLFGIGFWPAVFALFLYGLLPIVRNTFTGLTQIQPSYIQAAEGLGLTQVQILRLVRLPLGVRFILSGIRTSAVIGVGTATLAAFIGAGGLGDFILTGLSLNNNGIILQGAIPAAILAVFVDRVLALVQWRVTPKGLRLVENQAK